MDENPYQSPEPPEEPVDFRERGETWRGWRKMSEVGVVTLSLSVIGAIGLGVLNQVTGIKPSWHVSLGFMVAFFGSMSLVILSRIGAYLHSVVLMFRDEYN